MLKRVLLNCLSAVFRVIPRNGNLWITGKITSWEYSNEPPAFFDNSKYFFLYLVNHTTEKVYWLSSSNREIEMLHKMNLPVVRFPSVKGVILALRAKFSFHHYGPNQINSALQRGSVQLDFWHGTPLKKIRYDVVEKPIEKNDIYHSLMSKGGAEYVFSTSNYLSESILSRAFAVDRSMVLDVGYPRTDVMALSRSETYQFCLKYSRELIPYIDISQQYDSVLLYMPTYRDDDPRYFEKADIDFASLSKSLERIGGVLFVKLHPLTKHSSLDSYDNIIQIGNDVDIYPFLTYTDYLVTDYSSILFDYLLLDKEIVFIPYDYEDYVSNRELYFAYDEVTPGKKFYSFGDFIDFIPSMHDLDYAEERRKVRELFIDNYQFDACEKTYQYMKEKYA